MDFSDVPSGRGSPRKELQGPRPAPLRVRKDSHKIRKPPMAPPAAASQPPHHHHHHAPPRPPVIIYTVSPKIIHANPNEFMSLVQRLTGPNNNYSPSASSSSSAFAAADGGGAVSPAARFASIEKTKSPDGGRKQQHVISNLDDQNMGFFEGTDVQINTGQFPGILSPNPNSLPPLIPPNFFSLPSDNNNYYNNNNPLNYYYDNSFILQPSPSTFISPRINTPSPNTLELFHSLFDM